MDGAVVIAGVSAAGPAQGAGLRQGDVVLRLNGERVADLGDFYRKLWRAVPGTAVELMIHRDGRIQTVMVPTRDRHTIFQFRSP
jgi:S1-C subfamily serine protease